MSYGNLDSSMNRIKHAEFCHYRCLSSVCVASNACQVFFISGVIIGNTLPDQVTGSYKHDRAFRFYRSGRTRAVPANQAARLSYDFQWYKDGVVIP